MAETTSSTQTGVKDTRDAPDRAVENVGSGRCCRSVLPQSINFVVEELTKFIDADIRAGRWWLPVAKQQVDGPPEFFWRRMFTLDRVTPKYMAFATTKFTVVASLSIPGSLGSTDVGRRTCINLIGSSPTGCTVGSLQSPDGG